MRPLLPGPVLFPCSGGLYTGVGWDTVAWCVWNDLRKGRAVTTEYTAQVPSKWAKPLRGAYRVIVPKLSDLTCLPLHGGERKSLRIILLGISIKYNLKLYLTSKKTCLNPSHQ